MGKLIAMKYHFTLPGLKSPNSFNPAIFCLDKRIRLSTTRAGAACESAFAKIEFEMANKKVNANVIIVNVLTIFNLFMNSPDMRAKSKD